MGLTLRTQDNPNNGVTMNLITRQNLASQLGVSVRTLDRWHARRVGPARVKCGNMIGYRQDAIEKWLSANETLPNKGKK